MKKILWMTFSFFIMAQCANASTPVASQSIAGATCEMYGNEYSSERLCDQGRRKNQEFSNCLGPDIIHQCYQTAKTQTDADDCIKDKVKSCCYAVGGSFYMK